MAQKGRDTGTRTPEHRALVSPLAQALEAAGLVPKKSLNHRSAVEEPNAKAKNRSHPAKRAAPVPRRDRTHMPPHRVTCPVCRKGLDLSALRGHCQGMHFLFLDKDIKHPERQLVQAIAIAKRRRPIQAKILRLLRAGDSEARQAFEQLLAENEDAKLIARELRSRQVMRMNSRKKRSAASGKGGFFQTIYRSGGGPLQGGAPSLGKRR